MPIAAKFSEAFYQKFGHKETGELVEYLNTIDTTYRAELERLNDLNWSRVESRIAQAEARLDQRRIVCLVARGWPAPSQLLTAGGLDSLADTSEAVW